MKRRRKAWPAASRSSRRQRDEVFLCDHCNRLLKHTAWYSHVASFWLGWDDDGNPLWEYAPDRPEHNPAATPAHYEQMVSHLWQRANDERPIVRLRNQAAAGMEDEYTKLQRLFAEDSKTPEGGNGFMLCLWLFGDILAFRSSFSLVLLPRCFLLHSQTVVVRCCRPGQAEAATG